MNKVELDQEALALLKSKFNIKLALDCRKFDTNPDLLVEQLSIYQGQYFNQQDKILLVHMDTDYYDPLLPAGLIPINVTRIFKNLDIPFCSLIFVTNHYGIGREFDFLLKDYHELDRPTVIETLLSPALLSDRDNHKLPQISFNEIEKPGLCMMNKERSHRVAFYNFLRNNKLFDKIAVSQHFNV
jgi:hypothetical protein